MNSKEKRAAVLQAVLDEFTKLEGEDQPQAFTGAPKALGERLGLSPGEVTVILRGLHHQKKIGLLEGQGGLVVARDQSLLRSVYTASTTGGLLQMQVKVRTPVPSKDEPEADEVPLVEQELRAEVATLKTSNEDLQRELTRERGRNTNAKRQLAHAATKAREDETKLGELRRRVRELTELVAQLQPEADRVPGLEQRLKELEGSVTIPKSLADEIARLTSTQ